MLIGTIFLAVFLAANMGVSGFAVSFTPSYGSGILKKRMAALLFGVAVLAGGIIVGPRVAETLVHKISASGFYGLSPFLIVAACAAAMFLCNVLKVPQSTSFVTVSAFTGAGLYLGNVNWATIIKILFVAVIFSTLSFFITYAITRGMYPPRDGKFHLYEFFMARREAMRKFIVGTDVYGAFGIGTNNVANVVAPLLGVCQIPVMLLFLLMGPFFGVGAFLAGERVIKAVSRDIVPVGEISASIVSLVTSTFVLIASALGLPAPYAQFSTFAVLGVSCAKDGMSATMGKSVVRRILWVWFLVPLLTVGLSYLLHVIFMRRT